MAHMLSGVVVTQDPGRGRHQPSHSSTPTAGLLVDHRMRAIYYVEIYRARSPSGRTLAASAKGLAGDT
jgi:hypothetical protein